MSADSAVQAIEEMEKLQDEVLLQALGTLCVANKQEGKNAVPRKKVSQ